METSAGVPQGSVLGPTLWNVLYDDLLRIPLPPGVRMTAYADDVAITFSADALPDLNRRIRTTLVEVERWLEAHHLTLAPEKTEAIVLKGPRRRDGIKVRVQGHDVSLQKDVKYLGIMLDSQGTWGAHVSRATRRTGERVAALTKILPNIGGPGYQKRMVLLGVVHSTLLYGAPIWHKALKIERYRQMMEAVQRKMLIRVACAYRTISAKAVQVITGTLPIHLLVEERRRFFELPLDPAEGTRPAIRAEMMERWQREWEDTREVAQWTKALIPDVRRWVRCGHRSTNYYTTQFLSGHGSFRSYTRRIGRHEDEECFYCGEKDTPDHTIFACPRWSEIRRTRWGVLDTTLTTENITEEMTRSPSSWAAISKGINDIMRSKEQEERAHQAAASNDP